VNLEAVVPATIPDVIATAMATTTAACDAIVTPVTAAMKAPEATLMDPPASMIAATAIF
jgi:hypothetical protein